MVGGQCPSDFLRNELNPLAESLISTSAYKGVPANEVRLSTLTPSSPRFVLCVVSRDGVSA